MRIHLPFVGLLSLCVACASNLSLSMESKEQPRVISVSPADGAVVDSLQSITVTLSREINPETVDEESFLVVSSDLLSVLRLDADDISDAIDDQELVSMKGTYSVSEDLKEITWISSESFNPQSTYQVIATSDIQTEDFYPLNQTPGQETTFFMSSFTMKGSNGVNESSSSSVPAPETLMINEVLYDSAESDSDGNVFVELYGTPGGNISNHVVRLVNGANGQKTDEIIFSEETLIPEDGFFVLADSKTGSTTETNVENADYVENFDPQNGPDSIQLLDPSGGLIDAVGYGEEMLAQDGEGLVLYEGTPAKDPSGGKSLSRTNMEDTDNNSKDFVINDIPSPGIAEVNGETATNNNESESGENNQTLNEQNQTNVNDVHFTEVVTDAQQDWNDSSGGNGIEFDAHVGSGTVGSSDEWIEIQNGRTESVDLTGWHLEMNDGTDATDYFDSTSAILVFSDGGDLTNFQPNEFLVLGNPSGSLNNSITLELYDPTDELIDSLTIDDANATGIEDESYGLIGNETWQMGEATIGF